MSDINKLQEIIKKHLQRDGSSKKFVGTIYSDVEDLDAVLEYFCEKYRGKADYILALEGPGFILGGMLARELKMPFVPVVKTSNHDQFGDDYHRYVYINHNDHAKSLVVRKELISEGAKVIIVDNWIETGATILGTLAILEDSHINVSGIITLGVDDNEKTRQLRKERDITTII